MRRSHITTPLHLLRGKSVLKAPTDQDTLTVNAGPLTMVPDSPRGLSVLFLCHDARGPEVQSIGLSARSLTCSGQVASASHRRPSSRRSLGSPRPSCCST